eukprot:14862150-Alexandrium_andersonii.AAC.1
MAYGPPGLLSPSGGSRWKGGVVLKHFHSFSICAAANAFAAKLLERPRRIALMQRGARGAA